MHGNFKILFLSLTLALFLAPGISLACSKKEKQVFKAEAHAEIFIKQSFQRWNARNVGRQPHRVSCASLGWRGIEQLITESEDEQ